MANCGETLDEALSMAVDYIAGYLYTYRLDNEVVPVPSEIRIINLVDVAKELETEVAEAFISIVTVDVDEYAKSHFKKSVKKTSIIPV